MTFIHLSKLSFIETMSILSLLWAGLFFMTLLALDFMAQYFKLLGKDQKRKENRLSAIEVAALS